MTMSFDDWEQLNNFNQQESYRQQLIDEDSRKDTEERFRKVVQYGVDSFGHKHTLDTLVDIILKRERSESKLVNVYIELEREVQDRFRPNLSAW
jgi:hypothetical protein